MASTFAQHHPFPYRLSYVHGKIPYYQTFDIVYCTLVTHNKIMADIARNVASRAISHTAGSRTPTRPIHALRALSHHSVELRAYKRGRIVMESTVFPSIKAISISKAIRPRLDPLWETELSEVRAKLQ